MPHGLTRRDFLRYSAAAAGSLWLASLVDWLPGVPRAAGKQQAVAPQPSFAALPLPVVLGAPADVAIGTDGQQWILSDSGAPSTYDPLQQVWQPFGGGIDAAAYIPFVDSNENFSVSLCFFRGSEVYQVGASGPVPIAQLWPNLPPSFQQGIDGATYLSGNSFYLFRQGQSAALDVWGNVEVSALSEWNGGPWQAGPWQDGMFDYVISGKDDAYPGYAIFVRSGQYLVVDLTEGDIASGPQPLAAQFGGAALALLSQANIGAVLLPGPVQATDAPLQVFSGPLVYTLQDAQTSAPAQAAYLPQLFGGWPAAWHPVLKQAPAGSSAALWSVTNAGVPLSNDATGWTAAPLPNNTAAVAVDCGADGTVYAISSTALYQLGAGGWSEIAPPSPSLQAVSVADAAHIWVLDTQGDVYFYTGGGSAFTQLELGSAAGDIKGSPDGTLWHSAGSQTDVYRFVAQSGQPSEAIPMGLGITSVQKTTASSYGAALFLAQQGSQPAIVRYVSPFLFKTSASYITGLMQTIPAGAGMVFVPHISADQTQITISALDAQTGFERWRYQYAADADAAHSFLATAGAAPLYDPQHKLLYVFQYSGTLVALDVQTGAVRWTFTLSQLVFAVQPLLAQGVLYFPCIADPLITPDNMTLHVMAIDTNDALAQAAGGQAVQVRWSLSYEAAGQPAMMPTQPIDYNGFVYQGIWTTVNGLMQITTLQISPATGAFQNIVQVVLEQVPALPPPVAAPVVAGLVVTGFDQPTPCLVFNSGKGIFGFPIAASEYIRVYTAPPVQNNVSYSNLVVFDGVIYFADGAGNVYGLDANFDLAPNLPQNLGGGTVLTPLTVFGDADGAAVILAAANAGSQLVFYSTATGNTETLSTNVTSFQTLSALTGDGLLFGGGMALNATLGQFFGIRVNDVSALRDFIIESQLLQDYDPGPVATPRYQTHITVVDDNKTPLPHTGLKIWADEPVTLLVDGQSFSAGPQTPIFTHVDVTGNISLASDAGDIFASPLRIWAAFMDPAERIVIYPDQEFHARLPSIVADPNNNDPTVINLATGTNYAGAKVFTDQTQAQQTAQAVATVCQSAGIGTGNGASNAAPSGAAPPPYIAYGDLPGMRYFPYNTPATRTPAPQNPLGLAWSEDTPGYATLGFGDAAAAIDALDGQPDTSLTGPLGSWFSGLWHKIKHGVAKVTKIVVSAGESIYCGIQYVVNGVTHVLRHVVHDLEDLAAMVGAFFVALGKLIADVIELLSLLLQFEQVIKTHNILKAAIQGQIANLGGTITNSVIPALNTFFGKGEGAITQAFCQMKQLLVPGFTCGDPPGTSSPLVSGLSGSGASAHTIFSAAPKNGSGARTHAVLATWGFHKVRTHFQQGTTASTAPAPGDPSTDPVLAFINSFAGRLTSDPTLQTAYSSTLQEFAAAFSFTSPGQFVQMAVFALLDLLQTLLVSSLAVTNAFLDGLLALADQLVSFLFDSDSGLLMQGLNIPILSDIYKFFVGSDLTFFDLVLLVASIPVTFLYRIIEGDWFSNQAASAAQVALAPMARAVGLLNAAFFFGRAIFMPLNDTSGEPGAPNPILSNILVTISGCFAVTTLLKAAQASDLIFVSTSLALCFTSYFLQAGPAVASFLSLVRIGGFIFDLAAKPSADAVLVFGGNLLGSVPALAQPLKYISDETYEIPLAVLVALEMIGNMAAGLVAVLQTAATWDAEPTAEPPAPEPASPNRLFIPYAATGH